jgi:hypothetical protein
MFLRLLTYLFVLFLSARKNPFSLLTENVAYQLLEETQ